MSELKPYFCAIRKSSQSIEQIANLALQLEVDTARKRSRGALAAEVRNLHNSHPVIEKRLPTSNKHILDSAELVLLHQFH